jgi:hypothetical protein
MIATLTPLNVAAPTTSPPAPQPAVRPVEAPDPPAATGGADTNPSSMGDLLRSARCYANLLQLTKDPRIAALFSGFGPAPGSRYVDVYA